MCTCSAREADIVSDLGFCVKDESADADPDSLNRGCRKRPDSPNSLVPEHLKAFFFLLRGLISRLFLLTAQRILQDDFCYD